MINNAIERYLARGFALGTLPVLLVLLGLMSLLGLTEELEDVGKGAFTRSDAVMVVVLSLPGRVLELAPVSALLGALIGLGSLANHQELTAIRSAGVSPWRIARPILLIAIIAASALLSMQVLVTPTLEREIVQHRSRINVGQQGSDNKQTWLRTQHHFVRVEKVGGDRILSGVQIFSLNTDFHFNRLQLAASAVILEDNRWLLQNVTELNPDETARADSLQAQIYWDSSLSREQTSALTSPIESLALFELKRFIDVLELNGLDTHRYRVQLWQQLGTPLALIGMALLGIPFVLGSLRSVSVAQRVAAGSTVGIAFYLLEKSSGYAATLLGLDPVALALGPDLVVVLIALLLISLIDGHMAITTLLKGVYRQ